VAVQEQIALVTAVVAVIGLIGGVLTYRRDVKTKQTEWLYRLFEKFYETGDYKVMRRLLDNPSSDQLAELEASIAAPGTSDQEEDLVDYLNFFEFICNLQQDGRMTRKDVDALFNYYLNCLAAQPMVTKYVSMNGFEALKQELDRRGH
jgi:hypothetical protein